MFKPYYVYDINSYVETEEENTVFQEIMSLVEPVDFQYFEKKLAELESSNPQLKESHSHVLYHLALKERVEELVLLKDPRAPYLQNELGKAWKMVLRGIIELDRKDAQAAEDAKLGIVGAEIVNEAEDDYEEDEFDVDDDDDSGEIDLDDDDEEEDGWEDEFDDDDEEDEEEEEEYDEEEDRLRQYILALEQENAALREGAVIYQSPQPLYQQMGLFQDPVTWTAGLVGSMMFGAYAGDKISDFIGFGGPGTGWDTKHQ